MYLQCKSVVNKLLIEIKIGVAISTDTNKSANHYLPNV